MLNGAPKPETPEIAASRMMREEDALQSHPAYQDPQSAAALDGFLRAKHEDEFVTGHQFPDPLDHQRYSAFKAEAKENFPPDLKGVFSRGEIISKEGDVFMGINPEGDAVLRTLDGNEQTVTLDSLHAAQAQVENGFDALGEDHHKELAALVNHASPSTPESQEGRSSFFDLKNELRLRINDEVAINKKLRDRNLAADRRANAEAYLSSNKVRFAKIAAELGIAATDPVVLLAHVEGALEREQGDVEEQPEATKGTQIEGLTQSERELGGVIHALERGKGETIPDDHLRRHRNAPGVREFVLNDIFNKIKSNDPVLADLHNWRWDLVRDNPSIAEYLKRKLHAGNDEEKPLRTSAIEQLKNQDFQHVAGLDDPANPEVVAALKDALRDEAGMSEEEIARILNESSGKDGLKTARVIGIRTKYLGQSGTRAIAAQMEAAVNEIPPVAITPPVPEAPVLQTETLIAEDPKYQDPIRRHLEKNMPELITQYEREGKLNFTLEGESNIVENPAYQDPIRRHLEKNMPELITQFEREGKFATLEGGESVAGVEDKDVAPISAAPTPPAVVAKKLENSEPISESIANKFNKAFGISASELGRIEGFTSLSLGQQELLLRNMQSEVLSDVTQGARETQQAEWQGRSTWGKIWRSGLTMGSYQFARTKSIEKELLARSKGKDATDPKRVAVLSDQLADIEEYVKVMKAGPDVEVKENGELDIKYVSPKQVFGDAEHPATPEQLGVIERFNAAASNFAKLPREWGYEPKDDKEKNQKKRYETEKTSYDKARNELLLSYRDKFDAQGEKNPLRAAWFEMNRIDERMQLNQLFNTHPNAEKALEKIENQKILTSAAAEFMRDKGGYIALGIGSRIALSLVIPLAGASLMSPFIGGLQGRREAIQKIRQRRTLRRLSTEDEREKISYTDSKGVKQVREIKEYSDATFFVDRILRLSDKLDQTEDEKERELLESKISQTTALMEEKFKRGLINFGGSSLEGGDERKGNDIANRLSFIQAMGRGAAIEMTDAHEFQSIADHLQIGKALNEHQEKIGEVQKQEIFKATRNAALIRSSFALAGALMAEAVTHIDFTGTDEVKEIATAASPSSEGLHSYSPSDIERVHAAILARTDPNIPKELMSNQNQADAKAFEEYMATKDVAVRHQIAETIGLDEQKIDGQIANMLSKPAAPAAGMATAGEAATPLQEAAAPVAAEAHATLSFVEADELAKKYISEDMVDSASGQVRSEWALLHSRNAETVLSYSKESILKQSGGADEWASVSRIQEYARANGFTNEAGIIPAKGESLEQFFTRAHTEHLMRDGVTPHATLVPAEVITTPKPIATAATEQVAPEPESQEPVKLVGGPGAVPNKPLPTTTDSIGARSVPAAPTERVVPTSIEQRAVPGASGGAAQESAAAATPAAVESSPLEYKPAPFTPHRMP